MFNGFSVVITMLHSGIHLPKLGYIFFPKSRDVGGKLRKRSRGTPECSSEEELPVVCGVCNFIIVIQVVSFVWICSV